MHQIDEINSPHPNEPLKFTERDMSDAAKRVIEAVGHPVEYGANIGQELNPGERLALASELRELFRGERITGDQSDVWILGARIDTMVEMTTQVLRARNRGDLNGMKRIVFLAGMRPLDQGNIDDSRGARSIGVDYYTLRSETDAAQAIAEKLIGLSDEIVEQGVVGDQSGFVENELGPRQFMTRSWQANGIEVVILNGGAITRADHAKPVPSRHTSKSVIAEAIEHMPHDSVMLVTPKPHTQRIAAEIAGMVLESGAHIDAKGVTPPLDKFVDADLVGVLRATLNHAPHELVDQTEWRLKTVDDVRDAIIDCLISAPVPPKQLEIKPGRVLSDFLKSLLGEQSVRRRDHSTTIIDSSPEYRRKILGVLFSLGMGEATKSASEQGYAKWTACVEGGSVYKMIAEAQLLNDTGNDPDSTIVFGTSHRSIGDDEWLDAAGIIPHAFDSSGVLNEYDLAREVACMRIEVVEEKVLGSYDLESGTFIAAQETDCGREVRQLGFDSKGNPVIVVNVDREYRDDQHKRYKTLGPEKSAILAKGIQSYINEDEEISVGFVTSSLYNPTRGTLMKASGDFVLSYKTRVSGIGSLTSAQIASEFFALAEVIAYIEERM